MRKVALLLALTMLLGSLVGCLGGDDDESASPVGAWYYKENMVLELKEDGTATSAYDNETGTWVTSGDTITITMGEGDPTTSYFAVEGDVLWVTSGHEDDECSLMSLEAINEDDWDAWVSAQTTPSMCE